MGRTFDGSPCAPATGRYPPIGDYAIIGDCRSAALVSRAGSIDWLCLPRFDSPSIFGALLDAERGGRFAVTPRGPFTSTRRYIGPTNVLETRFVGDHGVARLVDLMPVASEDEKRRHLYPDHQLLRRVECLEGEVEIDVVCDPRPNYGRVVPRVTEHGRLGLFYHSAAEIFVVRSEIPLTSGRVDAGVRGCARLRAGEQRYLTLAFAVGEPAIIPFFGAEAESRIQRSLQWWEDWVARCPYSGPHRDYVIRSALALKLMTYAPSGAVIAAPTTSLPEAVGGVRNWDYRYCWLRDASFTLRALFDLGYTTEAGAFRGWLFHATSLTWPELQVLYNVHGEARLRERELEHLEGYAGSRPVRVGNGAEGQLQLDTYGELIDTAFQFVLRGGRLSRAGGRMLVGLGKTVCRRWHEPDEGIWESRAGRRQHTFSKAMCWIALDRLLRLHGSRHIDTLPVDRFSTERDAIRQQIETRGYNKRIDSYVRTLDGDDVDASLLLLPLYGYAAPTSDRMRSTCARIYERLGVNGLLYRYRAEDGLPSGEGAFGICSFWGVECLARQGHVDLAAFRFEQVCSHANDVGLFAEEIDPESGAALGNFPQAFTHVGLINAALTLAECQGERSTPPPEQGSARDRVARR